MNNVNGKVWDVSELRDPSMRDNDNKYKIFYDESNNVRKITLDNAKASKLNIPSFKSFVLGGIFLVDDKELPDLTYFRDILKLQPSINEIKFSHIAKNGFQQVLKSDKLNIFLNWLLENDVNIHYQCTNTLYWSIVDIIDSIYDDSENDIFLQYNREFKSELYRVAKFNLINFLNMLNKYEYPNLEPGKTMKFIKHLNVFIHNYCHAGKGIDSTNYLNDFLRNYKGKKLTFCTDEENKVLVDDFSCFYRDRIQSFVNSTHTFDIEETIMEKLQDEVFMYKGKEIPYQFIDSKNSIEIQLSDVIAGLFGKYQDFLDTFKINQLVEIKESLNEMQTNNLELIAKLILKSDKLSNAFIRRIVPDDCMKKNDYFLHNQRIHEYSLTE